MSQYSPIILQKIIEDSELEQLSESEILDLEKQSRIIYPLLVPFLKVSHLWPFWTGIKKYRSRVSFVLYTIVVISTLIYLAEIFRNNQLETNIAVELCIQILVQIIIYFAMYFLTLNKKGFIMIRKLIIIMIRNVLTSSFEEKKFLQNYIDTSNFLSQIITGLICGTYTMYIVVIPILWPVTANLILPGNQSHHKKISVYLELFIDEDTYFFCYFIILSILCYIASVFISCLGIAFLSTSFFVIGKFRYVGWKLKEITHFSRTNDFLQKDDDIFKHVSQLVQLHQDCIDYFDLLNALTSPILFLGILSVIFGLSFSGCLIVIEYKEDINLALKMCLVYIICSEFLFVVSYPSQKIYDASTDIFEECYYTDWYTYSIKTRKMIQLMMMRSSRPSCVKIGPSTLLNFEMSQQIINLSLSYVISLMSIYAQ